MSALNENSITKLSSVTADMNTATATELYVVPFGKSCMITNIVFRAASISLTTAALSIGFNSASYNDISANATHTELTDSTKYTNWQAGSGEKVGTSGQSLKVKLNTLQGAAATVIIETFGYLI